MRVIRISCSARGDPRLERPDLQFDFSPFSDVLRGSKGAAAHEFPGISLSAIHLKPDARGTATLKSPDPLAAPTIEFNCLNTQYHLQALMTGMKIVRAFTQQPSLALYAVEEVLLGPHIQTEL